MKESHFQLPQIKIINESVIFKISPFLIFIFILLTSVTERFFSVISIFLSKNSDYLSTKSGFYWLIVIIIFSVGAIVVSRINKNSSLMAKQTRALIIGCSFSLFLAATCDILWLFERLKYDQRPNEFGNLIVRYFSQEIYFYVFLISLILTAIIVNYFNQPKKASKNFNITRLTAIIMTLPVLFFVPLPILNLLLFVNSAQAYQPLPIKLLIFINTFYSLGLFGFVIFSFKLKIDKRIRLIKIITSVGIIGIGIQILLTIIFYHISISMTEGLSANLPLSIFNDIKRNWISYIPLLLVTLLASVLRQVMNKSKYAVINDVKETTGSFGTAAWATEKDLEKLNAYHSSTGPCIGLDENNKTLFLPLLNKLTISPQGGGKSAASSIPVLLTENRPVLVFDPKGELWAVTARHRSEVFGREIVVIDPYKVTKGKDYIKEKPAKLLFDYKINPFDWVPEENTIRDRMINSFAASFIINEEGHAVHFDDNAKILIRGYIDYMVRSLPKKDRNLSVLFHLMSEKIEEAQLVFEQMSQLSGRAAAAANQISRVGSDERGSILSTSYRQIDWMSDSNIQETLSESNFDLRNFLKGNMDIFVVVPEDQTKEHSRLVRMIMSLLMAMLVQANPSDLPKKKMLFLLEELAQLGYCPDVEQCIEILRARGVVIWTVFQSLDQIDMFKKPDLFKGAPLKQIFTLDDTQTMQWIQTLGGKRTIVTKTLSNNSGDSRQKMQLFGGTLSQGEGESVHETGVDLIQLNEIRELKKEEQMIFLHGARPIRCKKIRYFEHKEFEGKYQPNPLEISRH